MKIDKYEVIIATRREELLEMIDKGLANGWQPYGPLQTAVCSDGHIRRLVQAMVHAPKIKEYVLVEERKSTELNESINIMMEEGWQPVGSPLYGTNNHIHEFFFAQALVRYEQEAK